VAVVLRLFRDHRTLYASPVAAVNQPLRGHRLVVCDTMRPTSVNEGEFTTCDQQRTANPGPAAIAAVGPLGKEHREKIVRLRPIRVAHDRVHRGVENPDDLALRLDRLRTCVRRGSL
jgi:hypothetical protein